MLLYVGQYTFNYIWH